VSRRAPPSKTQLVLVARLLVAVAVLLWPAHARANEAPVVAPPRDVPLVLLPSAVHVPPLPAKYQQKDLGWLVIAYAPGAHERVQGILAGAEAFKANLADELGQAVLDHVEVRIARTYDEMVSLAPPELPPPAYASGVAYPALKLVLITLTAPVGSEPTDLDETFRHELAHVALDDAVLAHHVPRWFSEGLAIHESGEAAWLRSRTLWDATLSRTVLPLADLDRSFPDEHYEVSIAYAESADFVRFLLRDDDRTRFASLVDRVRRGTAFDRAIADAYTTDMRKLEFQWREEIAKRYSFLPVLTGGSLLWVLVITIAAVGWVRKKKRDKATLARWEREEAATQAVVGAHPDDAQPPASVRPEAVRGAVPKVEHEGNWYTVH
jgi:hypothetical protein